MPLRPYVPVPLCLSGYVLHPFSRKYFNLIYFYFVFFQYLRKHIYLSFYSLKKLKRSFIKNATAIEKQQFINHSDIKQKVTPYCVIGVFIDAAARRDFLFNMTLMVSRYPRVKLSGVNSSMMWFPFMRSGKKIAPFHMS